MGRRVGLRLTVCALALSWVGCEEPKAPFARTAQTRQRDAGSTGGPSVMDAAPQDAAGEAAVPVPAWEPLAKLDADGVYLMGSYDPTANQRDGVAPLGTPQRSAAVPAGALRPVLHPTQSLLYYLARQGTDGTGELALYRADLGGEDKPVPVRKQTLGCTDPVQQFRVHPGTGDVLHVCGTCPASADTDAAPDLLSCAAGEWKTTTGELVLDGILYALGFDDLRLVGGSSEGALAVQSGDAAAIDVDMAPFEAIAGWSLKAVRAVADGFWVAAGTYGNLHRFHVAADGSVEDEGRYPELGGLDVPFTDGLPSQGEADRSMGPRPRLDGDGHFYDSLAAFGGDAMGAAADRVVKLVLGGEASLVYREDPDSPWALRGGESDYATDRWIYACDAAFLVTGP